MKMVIFGAGASFDCIGKIMKASYRLTAPKPLPLAANLFDPDNDFNEVAAAFPACRPLVYRLRRDMAGNQTEAIESRLGKMQQLANQDPEIARQLVALRFYLSGIIRRRTEAINMAYGGFTNYVPLLQMIGEKRGQQENVALVTFNYDTLLDQALQDQIANVDFEKPRGHVDMARRNGWKLLKLHGSASWSRQIERAKSNRAHQHTPQQAIAVADALDLTEGEIVNRCADQRSTLLGHHVNIPALAVPTDTKSTFECPSEHVAAFTNLIPRVDSLLIIGWKAQEQHALSLLKDLPNDVRVGIVDFARSRNTEQPTIPSDTGAALVWKNFEAIAQTGAHPQLSDRGFSGFLESGQILNWLEKKDWSHDHPEDRPAMRNPTL